MHLSVIVTFVKEKKKKKTFSVYIFLCGDVALLKNISCVIKNREMIFV